MVVPNDFTREWIESHFLGLVRAATRDAVGREMRVSLTVAEHAEPAEAKTADAARGAGRREAATRREPEVHVRQLRDRVVEPLRARRGARRRGGACAGVQPALHLRRHGARQDPSPAGDRRVRERPLEGAHARYVTSETFTNDFINSLRDKRIEGFKHRYRAYDVLLVDDIQFLEGKERFQEEFFHTFNSLYEAGRQIVISSDRPPKEIATLEERLRSRFEWGLITDIQPPDLETRIAILRKKVTTDGIAMHDPEVLTFIAGRVSTNIRELEGALTRVVAFSSLTGLPLDVDLAEQVLRDLFPSSGGVPEVTIAGIQEAVCDRFALSVEELSASGARRRSRTRVRSRCTCPASSPTRRCRRSGRSSAVATTRPCIHATRRSRG